jgi:hypothetical protein
MENEFEAKLREFLYGSPTSSDTLCQPPGTIYKIGEQEFYLQYVWTMSIGDEAVNVLVLGSEPPSSPVEYIGSYGKAVWIKKVTMPDGRELMCAWELENVGVHFTVKSVFAYQLQTVPVMTMAAAL